MSIPILARSAASDHPRAEQPRSKRGLRGVVLCGTHVWWCRVNADAEIARLRMALEAILTLRPLRTSPGMFSDRHEDAFRAAQSIASSALGAYSEDDA